MSWFRWLAACGCLVLLLLPTPAHATTPRQTFDCTFFGSIFNSNYVEYRTVPLDGATLQIHICAPEAQALTAGRLANALVEKLPQFDVEAGLPLTGSYERHLLLVDTLPLSNDPNMIYLGRSSADLDVIREGARFWANERTLAEPWMIEGYATYLAERATKHRLSATDSCPNIALYAWRPESPEQARCGRSVAASLFHDLAATIGAEPLRDGLRNLSAQSLPIARWQLLAALRQATNQDLVSIFMRYQAFPPQEAALLEQHQQYADRLQQLQGLATPLGIELPSQLADAINTRAFDKADRWLSRLEPFLQAASAIAERCHALALACAQPWQTLPEQAEALEPRTIQLLDMQKLLDQYAKLQNAARQAELTPPPGITAAVAALDPAAASQIRQALDVLQRGQVLEQACRKVSAPCPAGWREHWSNGNLALAAADIAPQTELLALAPQATQRCGPALSTCDIIWHIFLRRRQFVEARAALDKLSRLTTGAASLERRCGELADICHSTWQAALQREQLPGLERTLDGMERMLAQAQAMDPACTAAGWPCGQIWRAKFSASRAPDQAVQYLDDVKAALPTLQMAAALPIAPANGPDAWLRMVSGGDGPSLLADARQAFAAGDVMAARMYAEQALSAAAQPGTNGLLMIVLGGAILIVVASTIIWLRRPHPHATAARRPTHTPTAIQKPRITAAEEQLLEELLAQPPSASKQEPVKKKAA